MLLTVISPVQAQLWADKADQLLPEEQAFAVTARVDESGSLLINWSIADDYYMYRDQFSVESATAGVSIGTLSFPEGVVEQDPDFGEVVVYFYNVELNAPISGVSESGRVQLLLKGQGCNKPVGVCYPPQQRSVEVDFSAAGMPSGSAANTIVNSGGLASSGGPAPVPSKSFMAYVISALFAGILLSFTPCVLPMIPILAGVIAGQKHPSRLRSGWLAICYVSGTVITYIAAGAIAGASGAQLQAYFQNVWVISAICALLILLSGSLFGWYAIQLPAGLQNKLNTAQLSSKSASLSSFVLGLISALVVGACVSPVLILALGTAISQGDPLLGAAVMGAMAIGMGLLLILFGFGAGWLLPKAGAWMNQIQILFGFMVLGVAIYLLSTLSYVPNLFLWAALLLCVGFYTWLQAARIKGPLTASAARAISAALIIWGAMALIGGTQNGSDILRPLDSITAIQTDPDNDRSGLPFVTVTTLSEVQSLLLAAQQSRQAVLIDFYADWCLDCKRMHRTTFRREPVREALKSWSLIEIDVTDTSAQSEEVKRYFKVFGPPATLFVQSDGVERGDLRQYGFLDEQEFLNLVLQVN